MSGSVWPSLRVLFAGPGVTVQDGGRHGFLRYGVTVAGPMDALAHATANLALANRMEAAAIEISLGGIEVTAEGGSLDLAIAGGDFKIIHEGKPLPPAMVLTLKPGEKLSIRAGASGAFCYLAVAGGLDLPLVLCSMATHVRSHLGGLEGRALQAGDVLPCPCVPRDTTEAATRRLDSITAPWLDNASLAGANGAIRIMPGPQDDYFSDAEFAAFLARSWQVGPRSDRMAYALEGEPLHHLKGHDIVSDGIAHGAVQVPGSGLPFILMADRQPTGGYPKIATVIGADLGRVAQLRPGDTLMFVKATLEDALEARRRIQGWLSAPIPMQPLIRTQLSSEDLLAHNLISGVTSGAWD